MEPRPEMLSLIKARGRHLGHTHATTVADLIYGIRLVLRGRTRGSHLSAFIFEEEIAKASEPQTFGEASRWRSSAVTEPFNK